MEWSEGGKWDNCNSKINTIYFLKIIKNLLSSKKERKGKEKKRKEKKRKEKKRKEKKALAGVAQWIEGWPANQRTAGSIPSQGTCLGCGPGPPMGVCARQPIDVSLTHGYFSPFRSPFFSSL